MRKILLFVFLNMFGLSYKLLSESETKDMEKIEIICNDYLLEGEGLEISYKLYPENSKDRVMVYLNCKGTKVPIDISSGKLEYDYNKYNKRDFQIIIESRYNDVSASKDIKFISSDVIMIVTDSGEESGILKYYYRENNQYNYYEIDSKKSKELYEEKFSNNNYFYPDLENVSYYFSEGLKTDQTSLYMVKEYKIQKVSFMGHPYFETGKLKFNIALTKDYSYDNIEAVEGYGGISIRKNNETIGLIEVIFPDISDDMLLMQLKIIGDELEDMYK